MDIVKCEELRQLLLKKFDDNSIVNQMLLLLVDDPRKEEEINSLIQKIKEKEKGENFSCPKCGEYDTDYLIFLYDDGDIIKCAKCNTVYDLFLKEILKPKKYRCSFKPIDVEAYDEYHAKDLVWKKIQHEIEDLASIEIYDSDVKSE